jgi:hypothetical protein
MKVLHNEEELSWLNLFYTEFSHCMSIILGLGRLSTESMQLKGPLWYSVTSLFFMVSC